MCGMDYVLYYYCIARALSGQSTDGCGEKADPESVCACFVGFVAPARGQQVEQVISRVERVPAHVCGSAEVARAGNVIRGGEQPVILWAQLITLCSALLSAAAHLNVAAHTGSEVRDGRRPVWSQPLASVLY